LRALPRLECKTENLLPATDLSPADIFRSPAIDRLWTDSLAALNQFKLPAGALGVNPGDRRAVFYLTCALRPSSVLEIGTQIGASTVHIASALQKCGNGSNDLARMTTVDVVDVNCDVDAPWVHYGMTYSPGEMVGALGYRGGVEVEFVKDTSLHFMAHCDRKFDLIFLDGDHWGPTVYQEIPAALNLLNPNGVILLHDYFPEMRPLWSDRSCIPGPYLAVQQLRENGADLTVVPLGELPWPTKLQSNATSLAVVLRDPEPRPRKS
jgi:predicted O-methyltransferase YrrM